MNGEPAITRAWRPGTTLTERYERVARVWHATIERLGYLAAYRELVDHVAQGRRFDAPGRAGRVLDVGAGTGALSIALAERLGPLELELLDTSPSMLDEARRNLAGVGHSCVSHAVTIEAMEAARPFDVVASAHLIEHLADAKAAVAAMTRLLRPGGLLLMVVSQPHWCNRLVWLRWRHRVFAEHDIVALLGECGLRNVEVFRFAKGPPSRTSLAYLAER